MNISAIWSIAGTEQDEYSHGFLIPLISIWFIWERRQAFVETDRGSSFLGVAIVLVALLLLAVAELTSIYIFGSGRLYHIIVRNRIGRWRFSLSQTNGPADFLFGLCHPPALFH